MICLEGNVLKTIKTVLNIGCIKKDNLWSRHYVKGRVGGGGGDT